MSPSFLLLSVTAQLCLFLFLLLSAPLVSLYPLGISTYSITQARERKEYGKLVALMQQKEEAVHQLRKEGQRQAAMAFAKRPADASGRPDRREFQRLGRELQVNVQLRAKAVSKPLRGPGAVLVSRLTSPAVEQWDRKAAEMHRRIQESTRQYDEKIQEAERRALDKRPAVVDEFAALTSEAEDNVAQIWGRGDAGEVLTSKFHLDVTVGCLFCFFICLVCRKGAKE